LVVALLLLSAASASAAPLVICVNSPGGTCDTTFPDLQGALDGAASNPGPDTVRIGAGTQQRNAGFTYNNPSAVHIQGNGGRLIGGAQGTLLRNSTPNASGETVLTVIGSPDSTISGITVSIPPGSGTADVGIKTTGAIDNVLVQPQANQRDSASARAVQLQGAASLRNSDVLMGISNNGVAVEVSGGPAVIDDVRLRATDGITAFNAGSLAVHNARIEFGQSAVIAFAGPVSIDDSALEFNADSGASPIALEVNTTADDSSIAANHVTLVGPPVGGDALQATSNSARKADLSFRNGVISGFDKTFARGATGTGAANITTDFSDYLPGIDADSGPGAITETNHLDVSPGYVSSTDHHLAPGSPLIDAADPTETGGLDGDGNCNARRDIGAFEFTPGPRAPRAVATASLEGDMATFDASGSCDPDGDELSFDWTFDDGGGGPGASLQRTFSSPGLHFGTVTVTDSTGRSATSTASVVLPAPGPPAFPGAVLAPQRVRASKGRLVKVVVGCPAEAIGSCAGTLSMAGRQLTFFHAPGTTHKLGVKLSKKAFKKLKKKKRLNFTATAVAHDANGSAKMSTAKITVLKPRR
jgi:PKD domain